MRRILTLTGTLSGYCRTMDSESLFLAAEVFGKMHKRYHLQITAIGQRKKAKQ